MKRIGFLYQITRNTSMYSTDPALEAIPVSKGDILVSVAVCGNQTILLHPNGLVCCGHLSYELIEKSLWGNFLKRIE